MSISVIYPHIKKQENEPARLERTPRVRVAQIVMDYLAHGWSPDEMCRNYEYLSLAEAHAAMAYYYDHESEIDAEIEEEVKEVKKSRADAPPSSFVLRMKAKELL